MSRVRGMVRDVRSAHAGRRNRVRDGAGWCWTPGRWTLDPGWCWTPGRCVCVRPSRIVHSCPAACDGGDVGVGALQHACLGEVPNRGRRSRNAARYQVRPIRERRHLLPHTPRNQLHVDRRRNCAHLAAPRISDEVLERMARFLRPPVGAVIGCGQVRPRQEVASRLVEVGPTARLELLQGRWWCRGSCSCTRPHKGLDRLRRAPQLSLAAGRAAPLRLQRGCCTALLLERISLPPPSKTLLNQDGCLCGHL